jgi:hypothetical protein
MVDRDTVIALHEAGHCVVARCLALRCGGAIVAEGHGRADYEDEADSGSVAAVIAHMSGAAAEAALLGRLADGLAGDQAQIEAACAARGMTQDECDQLWRSALALVRANESSIRLIAEELQRRRALSGAEIDELMRPSLVSGDDEAAG